MLIHSCYIILLWNTYFFFNSVHNRSFVDILANFNLLRIYYVLVENWGKLLQLSDPYLPSCEFWSAVSQPTGSPSMLLGSRSANWRSDNIMLIHSCYIILLWYLFSCYSVHNRSFLDSLPIFNILRTLELVFFGPINISKNSWLPLVFPLLSLG